jgi:hypothetical protein
MKPGFAVFILMNNYFHDVATAMLMASSITMWLILRKHNNNNSPETRSFLLRLYNSISKIVIISWIWIVAGGTLRIVTFMDFEWAHAVDRNQEYGLIIKYIIAFSMMAGGTYLWLVLIGRIRKLKSFSGI